MCMIFINTYLALTLCLNFDMLQYRTLLFLQAICFRRHLYKIDMNDANKQQFVLLHTERRTKTNIQTSIQWNTFTLPKYISWQQQIITAIHKHRKVWRWACIRQYCCKYSYYNQYYHHVTWKLCKVKYLTKHTNAIDVWKIPVPAIKIEIHCPRRTATENRESIRFPEKWNRYHDMDRIGHIPARELNSWERDHQIILNCVYCRIQIHINSIQFSRKKIIVCLLGKNNYFLHF